MRVYGLFFWERMGILCMARDDSGIKPLKNAMNQLIFFFQNTGLDSVMRFLCIHEKYNMKKNLELINFFTTLTLTCTVKMID